MIVTRFHNYAGWHHHQQPSISGSMNLPRNLDQKLKGRIGDCHEDLVAAGIFKFELNVHSIANYHRWIVWKLAAMERGFPRQFAGRYLTYRRILYQFKDAVMTKK